MQTERALQWAKDRHAELLAAEQAGEVPAQYRAVYDEAERCLRCYIDGLADGDLTFVEGIKTAWHAWRTVREFWRLIG